MENAPETKKRGPRPKKLAHLQIVEFLRLARGGNGRATICTHLKISYRLFLSHYRADSGFAEDLRMIEASRIDTCTLQLYKFVTQPCDTSLKLRATVAYLSRHDKLSEARKARRAKAERGS